MIRDFGRMLHEGWVTKKRLSSNVSSQQIDALYSAALAAGALGGKLCGAGGGGFLLLVVPPNDQARLASTLSPARMINIDLDTQGSTIIYG
jgi:D-glycero-alpha-D-manno-heptose-7-phosphate kinase